MKTINYISTIAIPAIIIIIIAYAIKDKKKMYDIFIEGAKEGMKIVVSLFPTLLGIFIAVGTLRSSGILEIITNMLSFLTNKIGIPSQVIPLALLRPISGSASLAVATDIMTTYGVDSKIRINYINNDGVNRNHILCYCNIYKQFKDKKDKICVSCSVNC